MELIPTYSYYRIYRPGSVLKKHVDRPSCEVSASICFNYFYEHETDTLKWPIFFNGTPLVLKSENLLVYKGMEVPHWREELKTSDLSFHIQGFFHYVNKNGPHTDHT
jgi:hypothetical protein